MDTHSLGGWDGSTRSSPSFGHPFRDGAAVVSQSQMHHLWHLEEEDNLMRDSKPPRLQYTVSAHPIMLTRSNTLQSYTSDLSINCTHVDSSQHKCQFTYMSVVVLLLLLLPCYGTLSDTSFVVGPTGQTIKQTTTS